MFDFVTVSNRGVYKKRWVSRKSKNVIFYKVETVNEVG